MKNGNFEKWFAGSKVIDGTGQPLRVYHGTGASVSHDFAFNPRFMGQHGSSEGYGFYFSSDRATADGYQKDGGATLECFLSVKRPLPLRQKRFTKAQLTKILKATVELEIASSDGEIEDFRDSFLSNYADTYSISFRAALSEAAEMEWDGSDTAVDQIASIANAAGDKTLIARAVQKALGYDGIVANGYDDLGQGGGQIYIAWFPEQIKAVANSGAWDAQDARIYH